jgi:ABC-2 type transport system permease protein
VLVAISIKQPQTFTWVMQLLMMPMYFLSGALYPVSGLPAWLGVLTRLNPLTYAVHSASPGRFIALHPVE